MKKTDILSYSATAGIFLLCPIAADSQIIYTDIEPDHLVGMDASFPVDLNNDGIAELNFTCAGTWSWTSFGGGSEGFSTKEISIENYASIAGSGFYPSKFYIAGIIDSGADFTDLATLDLFAGYYNFGGATDFYFGSSWINNDGFLAVKFNIDSEAHYGWIRLNLYQEPDSGLPIMVVKDYAYNAIANEPLMIELFSASSAENLILADIGETNTASDLKLNFDMAADESTVSSYRVILFPDGIPTLSAAETLSAEKYTEILPTGDDIEIIFDDSTRDVNGDLLEPDIYYRAVVLSMADGINVAINSLSFPSNNMEFSLRYASAVLYGGLNEDGINTGIDAFDVSFYLYGNDVSEIRVYITDDDYYYEVEDLIPLDSNYYTVETPYIGYHSVSINPDKLIYTSGTPLLFHTYYAYVITMPDTVNSTFPSLPDENMYDVFDYANTPEIPIVTVSNLTGTGSDVNIQYPKFIDENLINEYMIVVVPESSIYNSVIAEDLATSRSTHLAPNGSDININLTETTRDVDGHLIESGTTYSVYVTMKKFYSFCTSAPSGTFQLQEPVSISENLIEVNIFTQNNFLVVENNHLTPGTLKIYTSSGSLAFIKQINEARDAIALTNFTAGIYYAIFESEKGVISKKIFIE